MHAALVCVDRVRERVQRLGVAGVPLHRELDLTVVGGAGLDRDDAVDRLFALAEVFHEVDEAAVGPEDLLVLGGLALVDELDLGALVEECQLAQPLGEDLALELEGLDEDLGVGPEPHPCAGLRDGLALLEGGEALAALV